jgi:hypothetical protein
VTHSGNTQECTSLDGLDSLRCTTGQVLSSAMTGILHSHTTKENIIRHAGLVISICLRKLVIDMNTRMSWTLHEHSRKSHGAQACEI